MERYWLIGLFSLVLSVAFYNLWIWIAMRRSRTARDISNGIMKGAEPVFLKGSLPHAILMIHGFIGSPADFEKLPGQLHAEGYTVSVPLLPGHGRDPRDLSRIGEEDLIRFIEEKFIELKSGYSRISVVGISLGAALSVILASRLKPDALILLAPYFQVAHQWYYFLPVEYYHSLLSPWIPYVYRLRCFRQIKNREASNLIVDYDFVSLKGARAAFRISRLAAKLFPQIQTPMLVIASRHDKAVSYKAIQKLAAASPAVLRFMTVENSNHILLWDFDKKEVAREVAEFIARKA